MSEPIYRRNSSPTQLLQWWALIGPGPKLSLIGLDRVGQLQDEDEIENLNICEISVGIYFDIYANIH